MLSRHVSLHRLRQLAGAIQTQAMLAFPEMAASSVMSNQIAAAASGLAAPGTPPVQAKSGGGGSPSRRNGSGPRPALGSLGRDDASSPLTTSTLSPGAPEFVPSHARFEFESTCFVRCCTAESCRDGTMRMLFRLALTNLN